MSLFFYILLAAAPRWDLDTSISYVYNSSSSGTGSVWCASSGGVFHYSTESGIGTVYTCPEDLPIPDCRDLLLDSKDQLWIATGGSGLVLKDGDGWISYSNFEGIPGQGIVYSVIEASGSIWVGCSGGLARGDEFGFVPVIVQGSFNPDDVYSLAQRNDTLWMCTDRGIFSLLSNNDPYNPDSWTYWPETQGLQMNRIRTGEHSVYACGNSGAIELQPGEESFKFLIDYSAKPDSAIVDIMETSQGLLAAGRGVVYRRNGSGWQELGENLPSYLWPIAFLELEDELLISFSFNDNIVNLGNSQTGYGFYRLNNDQLWDHIEIPGIQCKKTHQMVSLPDGRLYVGTYMRGVQAYYPDFGWRGYTASHGMPNHFQTFSVAKDPVEGIWASSYHHGLSWIRDNDNYESHGDTVLTFIRDSLESFSPSATLIKADIPNNQPVMIVSQNNGLWAAFKQFDEAGNPDEPSGILGFNGDPMSTMNWAPRVGGSGIASVNTRAVYPISQDSLWIAFETGAGCQLLVHSGNPSDPSKDVWYPGSGEAFTSSSGLPSGEVFCFLNAPGVGFLVGTAEGLALWTGSGFVPYMNITEQIKTMSLDLRGRIWCLGTSGIYRIADDKVDVFNEFNSDFNPFSLYSWEFSATDQVNGGVFFSSIDGLWNVLQDGGSNSSGNEISFYPQPFLSSENLLRISGPSDSAPVTVDFFRLDGSYAGRVQSESVSNWQWDGILEGSYVASGVYMVLVTINETVYQARISVVR